ncbi:HNH endonuclease [Shewanella phage Spp001]|uniref:HNH endonuclease n=1 Tax=Shewanella phage Spp001 TaxID=1445859 RepID=W6EK89_9CAUD|nr:HNH endonuclease [Shewanella phage Spp001]AHJ10539.1 hypothetical protein Spp001_31 [Shewanella phage Spp001]
MRSYGYYKSEAEFLRWLRGALRKVWTKHPVKLEMLKKNRVRIVNPSTGKMTYHIACAHCKKLHLVSKIEVNHKETVGTITMAGFGDYCKRMLLVDESQLELLCITCHSVVTYQERSGMSKEEAALEKKIIAFFNKYPAAEQKRRMQLVGLVPESTAAKRRTQLREYLRKKQGL